MGRKVMFKRFVILLICSVFALAFYGCSNDSGKQNNSNSSTPKDTPQASTSSQASEATQTPEEEVEKFEDVTLTLLINWNGASSAPADIENNPVAKVIKEKTGVTLKIIEVNQNEVEKANTIFATQDLPDIYTGPAWAGGGEMNVILKAAQENQLVDLTPYLEKYPNLARSVAKDNVPQAMWDSYFNPELFGGKSYMLYSSMPATELDVYDWMYGLYVRKDIVTQLALDPLAVRTPDDLYKFLKAIKDANIQENGQPIIPMGGYHGGWAVNFPNKFFLNTNLDYFVGSDGTMQYNFMTKNQEDYALYMRKLISEGLIDPEAYVQSEAIATEKVSQGRYAVLAAHYSSVYSSTRAYVAEHPDAELVPVGPLNDWYGDPYRTELQAQGTDINVITKKSKNPDAAARVLDFLYSDEGFLLANYGVEGVHYDLVDGKPIAKAEWVEKFKTSGARVNEGIGPYARISGPDRTISLYGGRYAEEKDSKTAMAAEISSIVRKEGVKLAKGLNPGVYAKTLPEWEKVKPIASQLEEVMKQAFYAKSDEEALKLINDVRDQLVKAGIHDIEAKVNEKGKTTPLTQYVSRN